jgi:hypothetical protein
MAVKVPCFHGSKICNGILALGTEYALFVTGFWLFTGFYRIAGFYCDPTRASSGLAYERSPISIYS